NLEHSYSRNETASKNYYLLLQIAHIINQLMEKGSLLKKQIRKTFGSIRNVARQLLEDFRTNAFTSEKLQSCLSVPFQIRFELPP
ncbi:MAG: transposase, partial [Elusimicrobia bacterium CG_4_8_14_3_um_filter_50_9]